MLDAAQCSIVPVSVGPQILLLWHWWLMVVNFLQKKIGIIYSMDLLPSTDESCQGKVWTLLNSLHRVEKCATCIKLERRQKMAEISQLLCVGTETRKRQGRVVFSKNRFRSSGQLTTACLQLRCSAAQSRWHGGWSGLQVRGAMTLITNHNFS